MITISIGIDTDSDKTPIVSVHNHKLEVKRRYDIESDFEKVPNGLYIIAWDNAHIRSLATIGTTTNGNRWLACSNWIGLGYLKDQISKIAYLELLVTQDDINEQT